MINLAGGYTKFETFKGVPECFRGEDGMKKVAIFLICFAVVALAATIGLAKYQRQTVENGGQGLTDNGKENTDNVQVNPFAVRHLGNETYYLNNLEIEPVNFHEGDQKSSLGGWDDDGNAFYNYYYPYRCEYFKIKGLKDKELENAINDKIEKYVFDAYDKSKAERVDGAYVEARLAANFSNVLSICIGENTYYDPDYIINIDLTTGKEIELKDYFTDNAPIKNILASQMYQLVQSDHTTVVFEESTFNDESRKNFEEFTFQFINEINKGRYRFYFSETGIYILFHNDFAQGVYATYMWDNSERLYININDTYQYVAIFKRFAAQDSIFEKENTEDNVRYIGFNGDSIVKKYSNKYITIDSPYNYGPEDLIEPRKDLTQKFEYQMNYDRKVYQDKSEITYVSYDPLNHWYDLYLIRIPDRLFTNDNVDRIMNIIASAELTYDMMEGMTVSIKDEVQAIFPNESELEVFVNSSRMASSDEEVKNSSNQIITENEQVWYRTYADMTQLNRNYNEIFARHGHDFATKELRDYFTPFVWYLPEYGKKVSLEELNDIERENVRILKEIIDSKK